MRNVGASSPARPFSSGSSRASASAVPGRIGRPPTFALHTVEPGGSVTFRKLRWLFRTAYRASTKAIGPIWKERMQTHFPAMALLGVAALVEPEALVEIQAVAYLEHPE